MTSTIETEDVVRRLRTYAAEWHNAEVCAEAADTIERLREENARLVALGNRLAQVGDDKMATRKEWFEAITEWRAALNQQ